MMEYKKIIKGIIVGTAAAGLFFSGCVVGGIGGYISGVLSEYDNSPRKRVEYDSIDTSSKFAVRDNRISIIKDDVTRYSRRIDPCSTITVKDTDKDNDLDVIVSEHDKMIIFENLSREHRWNGDRFMDDPSLKEPKLHKNPDGKVDISLITGKEYDKESRYKKQVEYYPINGESILTLKGNCVTVMENDAVKDSRCADSSPTLLIADMDKKDGDLDVIVSWDDKIVVFENETRNLYEDKNPADGTGYRNYRQPGTALKTGGKGRNKKKEGYISSASRISMDKECIKIMENEENKYSYCEPDAALAVKDMDGDWDLDATVFEGKDKKVVFKNKGSYGQEGPSDDAPLKQPPFKHPPFRRRHSEDGLNVALKIDSSGYGKEAEETFEYSSIDSRSELVMSGNCISILENKEIKYRHCDPEAVLIVEDMDGDGDLDATVFENDNKMMIFENKTKSLPEDDVPSDDWRNYGV